MFKDIRLDVYLDEAKRLKRSLSSKIEIINSSKNRQHDGHYGRLYQATSKLFQQHESHDKGHDAKYVISKLRCHIVNVYFSKNLRFCSFTLKGSC